MIDSTPTLLSPAGAPSPSARSSAARLPGNDGKDTDFAAVLAQSADAAAVRAASALAREQPSAKPDGVPENDDETETALADAGSAIDLAALIALVAAESPPAPIPIAGNASGATIGSAPEAVAADRQTEGITITASAPVARGTPTVSSADRSVRLAPPGPVAHCTFIAPAAAADKYSDATPPFPAAGNAIMAPSTEIQTAGNHPAGPVAEIAARADAGHDPANMPPGLIATVEKSPPTEPVVTVQVAGPARNLPRAPSTETAGREGSNEGLLPHNQPGPVVLHAKWVESGDGNAAQKNGELPSPAAHPVDTAALVNPFIGAAPHSAGTHGQVSAGAVATLLVPSHVLNPAWSKDFGEHVIRLAVDGKPAAEIHLNPPDWGPIRVSIEIKGQDAILQFSADHPQTRDALEGALPRLREMFTAGDLTLAGASVAGEAWSPHSSGTPGQRRDPMPAPAAIRPSLPGEDIAPATMAAARPATGRSSVELFA